MKLTKSSLNNSYVYLIILGISLSYFSILGFRVLPFLVLISFLLNFLNSQKFFFDKSLIPAVFIIVTVFFMSFFINDFNSVFSIIIFFLIVYWPQFLRKESISQERLNKYINVYVYAGFFMGVGVLLQYILYKNFGITIGKVDELYERIGFGFIWTDFSFFSLYLASIIPIVWHKKNFYASLSLSLFFLYCALITSARTGPVSVFILLLFLMFIYLFKVIFYKKRFNLKRLLLSLVPTIFLIFFLKNILLTNFSRVFDLDPSGRFDGYYESYNFLSNNIVFGAYYNIDFYKNNVGVIPHNLFIYNIVLGGVLFFIVFIFWFLIIVKNIFTTKNIFIRYSLLVCIIVFQFIPAIFTAYFFAFLLSLMFYSKRLDKLSVKNLL